MVDLGGMLNIEISSLDLDNLNLDVENAGFENVLKAAQDEVQTEVGGKQGPPPLSGASCNRPLPEGYLTRGEIKQILIGHDVIDIT